VPIVFVSGHSDVPSSVRAMRHGAVDFLQKPFPRDELLDALFRAISRAAEGKAAREEQVRVQELVGRLSERELQVCELAVQGITNAEIAALLGTNENTVKSLRKRAMDRMGLESLPDLVRVLDKRRSGAA
jgi:FixJ family two-component response regulator